MKKLGMVFSGVAFVVTAISYIVFISSGSLGALTLPLFFLGFGLPVQFGLFFKVLDGCGIKDEGCAAMSYFGGVVGLFAVVGLYFMIGLLVGMMFKPAPKRRRK